MRVPQNASIPCALSCAHFLSRVSLLLLLTGNLQYKKLSSVTRTTASGRGKSSTTNTPTDEPTLKSSKVSNILLKASKNHEEPIVIKASCKL
jgi:hypothetical protein